MVVQNAIIVVIVVDSIREAVAIGVDVIWGILIFVKEVPYSSTLFILPKIDALGHLV